MDVSFISVTKVLPAVVACMAPQFDRGHPHQASVRGRAQGVGKGGIVRDRRCIDGCCARRRPVRRSRNWTSSLLGMCRSRLPGTGGNVEYFFTSGRGGEKGSHLIRLRRVVDEAVAGGRRRLAEGTGVEA